LCACVLYHFWQIVAPKYPIFRSLDGLLPAPNPAGERAPVPYKQTETSEWTSSRQSEDQKPRHLAHRLDEIRASRCARSPKIVSPIIRIKEVPSGETPATSAQHFTTQFVRPRPVNNHKRDLVHSLSSSVMHSESNSLLPSGDNAEWAMMSALGELIVNSNPETTNHNVCMR